MKQTAERQKTSIKISTINRDHLPGKVVGKTFALFTTVFSCHIKLMRIVSAAQSLILPALFSLGSKPLITISKILKNIIKPEYAIAYSKPFHSKSDIDIAELWDNLFSHLNKPNRAAILCIESKAYGHWTVVKSITKRRLTLFDSDKMHWLNRSQLTTTDISPKTPVYIYPTSLFLCRKS